MRVFAWGGGKGFPTVEGDLRASLGTSRIRTSGSGCSHARRFAPTAQALIPARDGEL